MTEQDDTHWIRYALMMAKRGLGRTGANPAVGCVIVKDGVILGRGRTGNTGRPHAERHALDDAVHRAGQDCIKGATAYVTLEPCAHTGKTPPCTDALIAYGIARVVAPFADPDDRVSGKGFAMLRAAGIEVLTGIETIAARAVLRGYLSRHERQRPFLTLKMAGTLDGRIATSTGESRWITGDSARKRVHLMRAQSDAILIGVGSVLADDPTLDVRLPGLQNVRPFRVVADTRLQTPLTGRLAQSVTQQPLILITSDTAPADRVDAFRALGATVVIVQVKDGSVALDKSLKKLAGMGIGSVLCEGGARLAAGLLKGGHVDELAWFTAGAAMGDNGTAAVANSGVTRLAEMPRFEQVSYERTGNDVLSVWRPGISSPVCA